MALIDAVRHAETTVKLALENVRLEISERTATGHAPSFVSVDTDFAGGARFGQMVANLTMAAANLKAVRKDLEDE